MINIQFVLLIAGSLLNDDLWPSISHNITQQVYVYLILSVYISRDFSSSFAIEMYRWPFFSGPSLHIIGFVSDMHCEGSCIIWGWARSRFLTLFNSF